MSKKNKPQPYIVKKSFDDLEYIADFLISEVEDGNMTWKDAIREAVLDGARTQWFDDRFDTKDLIGTTIDTDTFECEWEMLEDYQLNY